MPKRSQLHPLAIRLRPPFWEKGVIRPCEEPGCITVLNGYNPGPNCLRHTEDERTQEELDRELDRDARRETKAHKEALAQTEGR